jgi:small subunit ribosomal protein S16
MAVKIRLARFGRKKHPQYRIVVANATAPRDGDFLEIVGRYHPLLSKENAERVVLNLDRIKYWFSVGAQPTKVIGKLIKNKVGTTDSLIAKTIGIKAVN